MAEPREEILGLPLLGVAVARNDPLVPGDDTPGRHRRGWQHARRDPRESTRESAILHGWRHMDGEEAHPRTPLAFAHWPYCHHLALLPRRLKKLSSAELSSARSACQADEQARQVDERLGFREGWLGPTLVGVRCMAVAIAIFDVRLED